MPTDRVRRFIPIHKARLRQKNIENQKVQMLERENRKLRALLALSTDYLWTQDTQLNFVAVSDNFKEISGISAEVMIGRNLTEGLEFHFEADALSHYTQCTQARSAYQNICLRLVGPVGIRYISMSGEPDYDEKGEFKGYHGIGRDITRNHLNEQQVHHLTNIDALTLLPNRRAFLHELGRMLVRAKRHSTCFSVLFVDIDRFKNINDSLGHEAGDALLMSIAEGLSGVLRRSDLVARLGDDEFVALIDDCGDMETASVVARKTLGAISQPHLVHGEELLVTGSIGISMYPIDSETGDDLLKHADTAMFHAKTQGKNTYQFYSQRMAEDAAHKLSMEIALRHAIARNELLLHYQPKINIKSGEIVGMEALVRWKHPVRGMMAPGEFISLAEERGLIKEIGAWVIMTACKQCRLWQDAGFAPLRCAVNLSARQLQEKNLVAEVKAALEAAGVDGSVLEFEITESMLMSEPQQAIATLHQLRAMGISIAIDDFGTGYSSLAYLKDLPATSVKIDRSFINGLPKDPGDTAITKAIIALAQSLGLQVVAEGVETLAQLDHLRLVECTEAQGYYFSRPVPADRLSEWLSPIFTPG